MTAIRHRAGGYISIAAGIVLLFGGATAWGEEPTPDPGAAVCAVTDCEPADDASDESASSHDAEHADSTHTHDTEQTASAPAVQQDAQGQQRAAAAPAPRGEAARSAQTKSASVDIGDNFFDPKELTITVGTTVMWTNKGERPHTSTADDGSWDSGADPKDYILPGQSFSHTFNTAGKFPYYCRLHGGPGGSGHSGVITVTADDNGSGGQQPTTTNSPRPTTSVPGNNTRTSTGTGSGSGNGATDTGELAKTGPEHLVLTPIGIALIAAGTALVRVGRRRAA